MYQYIYPCIKVGDADVVIKKMKTIVYRNSGVNLISEVLGGYLKQQDNTKIDMHVCTQLQ